MTDNTLIIKMTKNWFFRSKQYTVKVDGSGTQVLNYSNPQAELKMLSGKYAIEVSNGALSGKMDITLGVGAHKIVQINPAVTIEQVRVILVIMAVVTIIAQYLITDSASSFSLFFIPIIPLLFLGKKQFPDSFVLTYQ